jgi:hypothetical protein
MAFGNPSWVAPARRLQFEDDPGVVPADLAPDGIEGAM